MPDRSPERRRSLLSKLSLYLPFAAAAALLALLILVGTRCDVRRWQSRGREDVISVTDFVCTEYPDERAPIGVRREFTFTLGDRLRRDTCLAFYTVHQYVDVLIDGRPVESVRPAEGGVIRTVGSLWTMVELDREDAEKEIRVVLQPVYERFREREVTFLVGSELDITLRQLLQDMPELLLSLAAVLAGFVFLCIGVFGLIRRRWSGELLALGLFAVCIGLCRMTDMRSAPFFAPSSPLLLSYVSLVSAMLAAIPMMRSVARGRSGAVRCVLDCYCVAAALLCLTLCTLQLTGVLDLREGLTATLAMAGLGAAIVIGVILSDSRRRPAAAAAIPTGSPALCLLILGPMADIVAFFLRGNSAGLIFSLLAVLLAVILLGTRLISRYTEQERLSAEKDRLLAETRMDNLMGQIQPHFIYNTLGAIEYYCREDPEIAAGLIHDFSLYLRGNFGELGNRNPIPLSHELDHTRYYVNIEKVRFPDITVRFDIRAADFRVPALSVQPLVENAIKHGLMKLERGGEVTVTAWEDAEHYHVAVEDNGPGFDPAEAERKGGSVGLRNIRSRLEVMCGGTLSVESAPGRGTRAEITIPKNAPAWERA